MPKKSLTDSTRVNVMNNGIQIASNDTIIDQNSHNDSDNDNDGDGDGDDGSDANRTPSSESSRSSPERDEPFENRFHLKLTTDVTKDGHVVLYTIRSVRINDGAQFSVQREYDDFEYLHHCLTTEQKTDGIIIPPLPLKPAITADMAIAKSRKQLGPETHIIIGDEFNKDCWQLQDYLRLMLCHPIYGKSEFLDNFVTRADAAPRAKLKKNGGIITKITDSFDNWKYSHKDCDEFFQRERDYINLYSRFMKEASDSFNNIVFARQKFCEVISHLSAAFNLNMGHNEGLSRVMMKFCSIFSKSLDDYSHGLDVISYNDEATFGATLHLWNRYVESHKAMLYRRTCLQIEYENSNRSLDKAKTNKRKEAEDAKLAVEKAFEECSDAARQEIKRFHRDRILALALSLRKYGETQLVVAKDIYCVLHNSLENLKSFEIQ